MHVLYVIPMQRGQRGTSFTITDRRKSTYDRHADHAVEDEIFTCVCVCVCVGVGGGGGVIYIVRDTVKMTGKRTDGRMGIKMLAQHLRDLRWLN